MDAATARGIEFLQAGKYEEAAREFQDAIKRNPSDVVAHENYAHALFQLGQIQQAIVEYETTLRLDPNRVQAYYGFATAQMRLSHYAAAEEILRRAISLESESAPAYALLGAALAQQNKLQEAVQAYTTALALNPDDEESRDNLLRIQRGEFARTAAAAASASPDEPFTKQRVRVPPIFFGALVVLMLLLTVIYYVKNKKKKG